MSLPAGTRLGAYEILTLIGSGGMGEVYHARDGRLDRDVAVKVLPSSAVADAHARERFDREARIAARVSHPNVCQLYDVGESNGRLFIVMERLEGESLAARLNGDPLRVDEAVRIGLEVLAALDALHRCGITHRDLKPSNILLTLYGAKVLDFGLARLPSRETSLTHAPLTQPGTIIGTPKYMAPEQFAGSAVEPATDLFAVGAILYEMLSGVAPFEADTIPGIIEKVLHADIPVLGGSPAVAAADRVIHCALAKSPAHRYASAAAMADDLRTVLHVREHNEARRARAVTRVIVLPFRLLRPDAEIDFLTFSLADALANSLSSLESLVVRSTLVASRFTAAADPAVIANEAHVDIIVNGTLLRIGDTLRVSVQLLEATGGTVRWSYNAQVSYDDVFQLEDILVQQIVASLTLPLSGREDRALRHDVPASAKAYEFYLRANPLSRDRESWAVARDLYLQSVKIDPSYAPAWARLGRVYRLLAKFPGTLQPDPVLVDDNRVRAESALNRALTLNPDLVLADGYYAQLELDLGRALEAMARLVRRASARSNDTDLFVALVSTCRYCGLLPASFAADERARRLDPNVRTSVTHTLFMAGRYLEAAAESEREWQAGNMGATALLCAGHVDAAARGKVEADRYGIEDFMPAVIARDRDRVRSSIDEIVAWFQDPEYHFYAALMLAYVGDGDRATELLAGAVDRGFFPFETFRQHEWLDSLRGRPDFVAVLQHAEHRHQEARKAFVDAGGETLLGVRTAAGAATGERPQA
jgi:serine/threonine protein kinase